MGGVCWAQPRQHSHTVRGTKFHGLQFKAGKESPYYLVNLINYLITTSNKTPLEGKGKLILV